MRKMILALSVTLLLMIGMIGVVLAETLTPEEILIKVDQNRYPVGSSFKIQCQMFIMKDNEVQSRKDMEIYVQNPAKGDGALVKFVYPKDDYGKAVLSVGENNWLYFPQTRKVIAISPQYSLMGGDFSSGDVTKLRLSRDYTATILKEEMIFDQPAYVLDLKAKDTKATYKHIILWVSKDKYLPLQQEFYTPSGKVYKTMVYKEFTVMEGVTRPTTMIMTDAVQTNKKTVLVFKSMKKVNLPDSMFAKSYLESGN